MLLACGHCEATRVLAYRPRSQATTNPSRLGHTKRQRHVRHNISSSGKRATRNVATYATCGDCEFTLYGRINRKRHTPLFVFVAFVPTELRVFGKWTRQPRASLPLQSASGFSLALTRSPLSHERGRWSVRVRNYEAQRDWSANVTND